MALVTVGLPCISVCHFVMSCSQIQYPENRNVVDLSHLTLVTDIKTFFNVDHLHRSYGVCDHRKCYSLNK